MRLRLLAAATAMFAFSLAAHADTLFTLTGVGNSNTVSFEIADPSSFVAANSIPPDQLSYDPVAVTINGSTSTYNIFFFSSSLGGGFTIDDPSTLSNGSLYESGPALFSFINGTPVFTTGTFLVTPSVSRGAYTGAYSVNVSNTATPEPSSLALLGTGVLGVIGAARRRFTA